MRDLVVAAGGDPSLHHSWENVCIASDDEHPSNLGARVLTRALKESGCDASDIGFVVYCGVSRDYLPSWSVSNAVMRAVGVGQDALGVDIVLGCLASVAGIRLAADWLRGSPQKMAAVISAERWSYTIDRSDAKRKTLWSHADGAGCVLLGAGERDALAKLVSTEFVNRSDLNDVVRIRYGGTRFPEAPAGVAPFVRERNWDAPTSELREIYRENYRAVFDRLHASVDHAPCRVACNQVSSNFVDGLGDTLGISKEAVCRTGDDFGHVGTADVIVGLHRLLVERRGDEAVIALASCPYSFGGASFLPLGR